MGLPFVLSAQIRLRHLRNDLRFEMQDARDDISRVIQDGGEENIRSNEKVILRKGRGKGEDNFVKRHANVKDINEFFARSVKHV